MRCVRIQYQPRWDNLIKLNKCVTRDYIQKDVLLDAGDGDVDFG